MDDDNVDKATTFNGSEAPSGKRLDKSESFSDYYGRLAVANSLDFNGKWKQRRRETRKNASAILDAIAGQMQLTDFQKRKAHRLFSDLPSEYNESRPTALLALVIAALAAREDGRSYHPNQCASTSNITNNFTKIASELGFSYSRVYGCWQSVKHEVG